MEVNVARDVPINSEIEAVSAETQRAVARHLREIAMLLSMDGANKFKVAAFDNAADEIAMRPAGVDFGRVPGVGKSIMLVIDQFLETGTSEKFAKLAERQPAEALSMTLVHGIGAKTALRLHRDGIRNLDELAAAVEGGDKKVARFADAVRAALASRGRVPHDTAATFATHAVLALAEADVVDRVDVAGSFRRGAPTCKDVDLVAIPKGDREKMFDAFCALGEVIARGPTRAHVRLTLGHTTLQVDLWAVEASHWGAAMNYATGSKAHNIRLRAMAAERGWTVNEYGIWNGEARLGGEREEDLYELLGIPYVEPEDRK